MGRSSLLAVLCLTCFACVVERAPVPDGDPHANLACAECHQGGLADRDLATVPTAACTGSGCHADDIPGEVALQSVRFEHRGHGSTDALALGCAGCHTHSSGDEPIQAGPETCGLCHLAELSGERGADCRTCHASPDHDGMTSQAVAVPHEGLPWIEGGCLRCHYQVTIPAREVSRERCATCHEDLEAVMQAGIGEDLHPRHAGVSCASCHEADNHHIEAMSSAVNLQCVDCHRVEHDVDVDAALGQACGDCHQEVHQTQQALLLGLASARGAAAPSSHFMDGLTCRSCHVEMDAASTAALDGTSGACVGCHRPEYATVLRWWRSGLSDRVALVERYVSATERAMAGRGDTDEAAQAAAAARNALSSVSQGSGEHNLPHAHDLLEEALGFAVEAYQAAGRNAPAAPRMGRQPRQGLCAYCHYELDELTYTEDMDDAFHREVMGG